MKINGNQWKTMKINEKHRKSMISMKNIKILCNSMKIDENL